MVKRNKNVAIYKILGLFLTKHYSFNIKNSKFQSFRYRNVPTDRLGTGRRSLGTR